MTPKRVFSLVKIREKLALLKEREGEVRRRGFFYFIFNLLFYFHFLEVEALSIYMLT